MGEAKISRSAFMPLLNIGSVQILGEINFMIPGEFSKSVELIKQNIQSLEYQFGSFSVEVNTLQTCLICLILYVVAATAGV